MIVTIDGPAGTGKSTVARLLAERLGFAFLDTGAMYRAVALACLDRQVDVSDPVQCTAVAHAIEIGFHGTRVLLNGVDRTEEIRQPSVTQAASFVAAHAGVRDHMVHLQRAAATGVNLVTEGRDQGTVVFPDAPCKFFLTASPEERAIRRQLELRKQGQEVELAVILDQQTQRDHRDETRSCGPLRPAEEALILDTTSLTIDALLDHLEHEVSARRAQRTVPHSVPS